MQSPDLLPACEEKQTCSECRGTPSCSWCFSPDVDLPARCNNISVTEQHCPPGGQCCSVTEILLHLAGRSTSGLKHQLQEGVPRHSEHVCFSSHAGRRSGDCM